MNTRPILLAIGILLTMLSAAMVVPAIVDYSYDNINWQAFAISAFFTAFCGIALILTNQGGSKGENFNLKQAFLLTTLSWIALVAFAALPFINGEIKLSYTDAFFEAMSGLTTTGATVISGLDSVDKGTLLWRSILQWLGGIGIIVMAMAVLPMLKIGGMQLFRTESSDKSEKVLPRVAQVSAAISGIYVFLTIACAFVLYMTGMEKFDAICHAMTTIATAGFSTHDASIGYFNSPQIETAMIIFMIISGIPFVLYIQALRGKLSVLTNDIQVRWFIALLVFSVIVVTFWLMYDLDLSWRAAFRISSFNVISVTTTSGFVSADYTGWGTFPIVFMFLLCVVGGCTGSTTGGIKIFRFQVLYETAKTQLGQLVQPHGVFKAMFNGKPISETATSAVLSFVILFAFSFCVLAVLLSLTGLDYITSMSGSASAIANLGPGFGDIIGPNGNYQTFTDTAKWLMTAGMLIGRLEIFTVLILFSPHFWKS